MSLCCGRPNLVLAPTPLSLEELDPLSVTHGTSELKQLLGQSTGSTPCLQTREC